MYKKSIVFLIALSPIFFIGCSSSDDSNNGNGGTQKNITSVSGKVIDGPVKGSSVTLKCEDDEIGPAVTNDSGEFTISGIGSSIDISSCSIVAVGGTDTETGKDLTGLSLKAPYSLYGEATGINVTPLTTMVGEHDSFSTNPEAAKKAVADFLGSDIEMDDLTKDPTTEVKLLKIAQNLVSIALTKKNDGKYMGIVDLDSSDVTQTNLTDFIANDLTSKIDPEKLADLKSEIDSTNNATSLDDVKKVGIIRFTKDQLESAYSLEGNTSVAENLKYLAEKIVAANKKDSKTHVITSYHIRKALTDLDLLPKFEDGELNITTADRLTLTLNEFQTYIDSKAINILDISGFVLFDASSYAQVVGNDQTKRRNYYAYSNKSNIASIIELTKVLYSDGVNDPINSEVAKGLTKLGFYDEGLEHIKDNVYTPSEKQDGYRTLGKLLLEIDEKTVAAKAFTKEYEIVKQTILSKDGQDESIATSEQNDLSYIIRHLSKTGHFEDNNSLEITGANTVINKLTGYTQYYLEANRYTATSSTPVAKQQVNDYQKITNLIDDLSTDFITYYNDIENARKSYDKNIELGNNFPADPEKKSAQFHLATIAIHGKIFGKDTTTIAEKAFGGIENGALSSSMKNLQVAYNALNTTDMDTVITELGTLSNSYVDDAIQRGAGTALFLNGQKDKLFTDYYGVDTYYSSSNKEKLMQYSTQLQPTNLIPTAMAIKILGTDSDLKDYLDRLRVLADTWYGGDSNISEGDAKKVYGYWSNTNHRNRYGYLAIASMYKDLGENQSAKDTINESIVKLKSFPDSASEKVDGLLNIWDAAKELGYENEIDVVSILDSLETFANTTTDVEDIVKIANILSINKKQTEAKGLLERALNQVNTDNQFVAGDKDNIKDRMKSLIGIYNNSSNFESSIANGYYQVGDKSKAEDIIKQVYETEIKSLGSDRVSYDTATQYDYLVSVVSGYGSLNDVTKLKSVLEKIKTTKEKELAYVYGAKALAEFDQLLGSSVASVDSDGDGKPDFFNLGATEADITASGLEIDDDIDGDGILDTIDTLPYDNVN